ncbi:host specificity protein J [Neisseria sp.]
MGGKSGGGASTPYEAPNTLNSAQSLRIIDAICEGEIRGFANGNDKPWKSVYFDDTPIQNPDGSFNFKGVVGFFQRGTPDQTYIPGFDASERAVPVSVEVKNRAQVVRAVSDELVSRLRVTVGVERNYRVADNGDTRPAETIMLVDLVGNNGIVSSKTVAFTEKSSGVYYQDVLFDKLPSVPFNIRVSRVSADSSTDREVNKTYFASYVEIIDAKLNYPHTALAALAMDSDQFGSNNPRRNYLIDGMLVNVPSNYDPVKRTYTGAVWDGSFKKAWTNNPAWVFYDVLTQPRYSTLARRLKTADIDKWTLYQVGKYCDELVDDGFGGKEPRFVCNVYITSRRQAGEFLLDLASVFRGLPVWDGNRFSLVMDADSDPVAMYNNSNVKDGLFAYSGVPLKSITTAVVVQYVDKFDGYRTKTEYVEDQQAVKRYGLNVKQITAFGCDSRGQAARYGAWVLETELRQQSAIKFTVGREGLRHLPYDVVQIMDNDYAGAEVSGRLVDVSGLSVTLDRDVDDAVGKQLSVETAAGIKSLKVMAQPEKNRLELAEVVDAAAGGVWILMGRVKPRLYRVIGTKENADDGTFEVSGILHDPKKYKAVDSRARFDTDVTTLHGAVPKLSLPDVKSDGDKLLISWDNLTADGGVLSYDIKIYRNNKLYRHIPDAQTADLSLQNLPNGQYRAEIRGRNARGVLSDAAVKSWTIDYGVNTLQTVAKFNAIDLSWNVPQVAVNALNTEIWYGTTADVQGMKRLAVLPYPQNTYTMAGVAVTDVYYFAVRIVDAHGNSGEYSSVVSGRSDPDPAPVLAQIQGQIGRDTLSDTLWNEFGIETDKRARAESARLRGELAPQINAASSKANQAETKAGQAQTAANAASGKAEQAKNSAAQNAATLREIDRKVTRFGRDSQAVATTVANLENATRSTLTLKTEAQTAGGQKVVTGISQTADGITNTSKVTILADKFEVVSANRGNPVQPFVVKTVNGRAQVGINGDLIADGTIQGRHIAASQTLQSPTIVAGALRMGTFSMNPDGSFESSAKEGAAGMSLFQYGLVIRDEQGRIRVVLGNRDKLK